MHSDQNRGSEAGEMRQPSDQRRCWLADEIDEKHRVVRISVAVAEKVIFDDFLGDATRQVLFPFAAAAR